MTNRKNYNSIVFLTTLSVYLGLVLVGTPPILAQAALTQKIEIQNEAEIKDDLDKKPDNENCTELKAKTDLQDNQFIEQYAKAILGLLKQDYASEVYGIRLDSSTLASEFYELFYELPKKVNEDLTYNGFTYTTDKYGFSSIYKLKPKFENKDISSAVSSYQASLNFLLNESQHKPEKVILKNTQITFENNQIFIVTCLPRASIDALLAKKDAH